MLFYKSLVLCDVLALVVFVHGDEIIVKNAVTEKKFNCNLETKYLYSTKSAIQCLHRCLWHEMCSILNYKITSENDTEANCEVFEFSNDNSCKDVSSKANWIAFVVKRKDSITEDEENQNIGEFRNGENSTLLDSENATKVYHSCKELHINQPDFKNGVYMLKSGKHYCLMGNVAGCSGGGWTGALKVDGTKQTFKPDSQLWTTYGVYNVEDGLKYINTAEAKFAAFNNMSFESLCIGMKYAGVRKWITIPFNGTSLLKIFQEGKFKSTNVGPAAWKGLIGGSSVQAYCNDEGFNVMKNGTEIIARIGIIGDYEDSCATPSSLIGIGTNVEQIDHCNANLPGIPGGNVVTCNSGGETASMAAMSYVLIR